VRVRGRVRVRVRVLGACRLPAETPNLKWPSPGARLPSFAEVVSGSGLGLGKG